MKLIKTVLTDALVIKNDLHLDNRGYFFESFKKNQFNELLDNQIDFVQDNISLSKKGTLRGLHFQYKRHSQAKLVRVLKGSVYDVAVDLRKESPTFLNWYGLELNEKNNLQFFIPRGFAHGFLALESNTIFSYKVDNYYSKNDEGGVIWNDEVLNIEWPKIEIIVSEKDNLLPQISNVNYNNIL